MKTTIEVSDKQEAALIQAGLDLPDVRAFVKIAGLLEPMSNKARGRILAFVADKLSDAPLADTELNKPPF